MQLFSKPFIEHFKLNELAEIVLVPNHTWDLVVNTGVNTPAQVAKQIDEHVNAKVVK